MKYCCERLNYALQEEDSGFGYYPKWREYYVQKIKNDPVWILDFCPFCALKFPNNLRDEWAALIEEQSPEWKGIWDQNIPEEFKTDEWWKKRGL